jgi:hypothetical protein
MAGKSAESAIGGRYIGPWISALGGAGLTNMVAGWTGAVTPEGLVVFSLIVGVFAFGLAHYYRRCLGVLGANRRMPAERRAYDALRNSLTGDNLAARLYARWLTVFLDRVDRFFGDAGKSNHTLFPHAFGLKTPAPLWTASALDRCLLLALIYPIATILIIWAVSGHFGPAEFALHLDPDLNGWQRCFVAGAFGLSCVVLWRATRTTGRRRLSWAIACILLFVLVIALSVAKGPPGNLAWGSTKAGPLMQGAPGAAYQPFILTAVAAVSIASAYTGPLLLRP